MKNLSNEKLLKAVATQEEKLANNLEIQKAYPTWSELKEEEDKIRETLTVLYIEKRERKI